MPQKMIHGYVRKIGNGICVTFPNEDFTMLNEQEFDLLPEHVRETVEAGNVYEGDIPESLYRAEVLSRC